jgi:hypothetical protein
MKLCPRCGKPDHQKHFCVPVERKDVMRIVAPVVTRVEIASPNAVHAVT